MKNAMFESYEAYKYSGVEWIDAIPSHWVNLRLKDIIAKLESGVSVNASDEPVEGGNIGVLKTSCVGKDKFLPQQNKSVWSTEIDRVCVPVRAGRIIISRMNTPQLVGASAYIPKDYPNLFLPDRLWQTVFFANAKLNPKWLSFLIGCSAFRFLLSTLATGTSPSMKNLGQEKLLNIELPFPSLPEQIAIATYLDTKTAQIDLKIDLLSQKAVQYGKLKQSIINETVTRGLDKTVAMKDSGVEWIGEVPEHWGVSRLKDVGFLYSGLTGKSGDEFTEENQYSSPFVPFTNIANNFYLSTSSLKTVVVWPNEKQNVVRKNDLFFLMSSEDYADLGKCSLLIDDMTRATYLNSFCRGFRFYNNEINPLYINYLLHSSAYRANLSNEGKGFTRINLKIEKINDIKLVVPPKLEQTAIATYLDTQTAQIDQIITTINTQIDKLKELRKTLINEVVTGKIKVLQEGKTV